MDPRERLRFVRLHALSVGVHPGDGGLRYRIAAFGQWLEIGKRGNKIALLVFLQRPVECRTVGCHRMGQRKAAGDAADDFRDAQPVLVSHVFLLVDSVRTLSPHQWRCDAAT